MAALLLKLKCLKHLSSFNKIAHRKDNFQTTAKNLRTKCDTKPSYRTRLALPPDYENVVDFMCEWYYKYEPVIINVGLEGTEAPPVWRTLMHDQVKAGYSIIAEGRDNCIVGAALNYPTDITEGKKMCELAQCCEKGSIRSIIEFFGYIAEAPKLWQRYCVSRIFEQCSLAVRDDFQRVGVAKRLVQESWLLARDCGFRLFRLDCNSSYCAKIPQAFGWPVVFEIPFSQYVKNGEIIFKCVKEPHTVCRVFVDHLRCKNYCPPYKPCRIMTPPPV